ncbi:MAG: hypothetical protein ACXABY_22655 [Candidatus Thorarchaeota archaeon]|jgi:hypothetical protein
MAKEAPTVEVVLPEADVDAVEQLKSLLLEISNNTGIQLTPEQMDLVSTDWNKLVREDGKIDIDGTEFITLAELRRLARLRGYISSKPTVVQTPVYDNHRQATVEWEIMWRDGTIDGACADASWRTCNPGFRNFTVPIASNRAEARCIRAALGIEVCSFEEVGPEDQMVEMFGDDLGTKIVTDGTGKLSHEQAVKAMALLNKYKPAKKEK